ncbi:MAG: hypothetical protein FJ271_22780 [Planctomycetes bacterium]|nr:hypothetical protein [Planctomycetota bacterium]
MDHERDVGLGKRSHGRLGKDVLPGLEDFAGESSEQKAASLRLRFLVRKGNNNHHRDSGNERVLTL